MNRSALSFVLLSLSIPLSGFAQAVPPVAITWSEHIAPIIYNNCTTCHRTGQVTPFTLMNYQDVAKHALTIASVTQTRYMPPWKPEPGWASYRDERRLTASQIALIQQWVAAGMPQGDQSQAPAAPTFPDSWQLGTPDLILTMPKAFSVPADGPDIYRNFVLPTGLTDDRYIRAIELKPSARGAVHHVLFYSDLSGDGRKMDGADGQPGFPGFGSVFLLGASDLASALKNPALIAHALAGGLGGWVPGTTPQYLPTGIAYALPKGADLILQTHFHPDGKPESEQTTMGLYFTSKPAQEITQIQAPGFFGITSNLDIPAGQSDYMLRGSFTLPVPVDAFSVSAHAHYLGKGSRMTATLPGTGEVRVLLSIKDWDFNWQDTYIFKDLVSLPAGTRIDGELIYDNSATNPFNPFSPPKEVKWGENSIDEMGSLILNVVPHNPSDSDTLRFGIEQNVLSGNPPPGSKPLFISSGVLDAASEQALAVSPGKIIVLYGNRLGPETLTRGAITSDGKLSTTLANSQVLFDGAPVPLLYSSAGQVAVIAPYALDGKKGTQVQVRNGNVLSDSVALPVTPTGPGIFSLNLSGTGPGVILNQDGITVNSSAKPAEKGSIIVIFATGEGQTNPAGIDGQLATSVYPKPLGNVLVNIGGLPAEVLYAGAVPTGVAGAFQVNARIPAGVPSGDIPVQIVVGAAASQDGITVSVK
ncbi:MAG: hypothetical protein ABJC09_13870 [Terriglobia bacterium]